MNGHNQPYIWSYIESNRKENCAGETIFMFHYWVLTNWMKKISGFENLIRPYRKMKWLFRKLNKNQEFKFSNLSNWKNWILNFFFHEKTCIIIIERTNEHKKWTRLCTPDTFISIYISIFIQYIHIVIII